VSVFVSDEQSDVEIELERWLGLVRLVLAEERAPVDAEVSLIFVDEPAIADLKRRFLGGSGPTDVLAFPIDDDHVPGGRQPDTGGRGPGSPAEPGDPPVVLGDVVVCPLVAERVLHLLNYDHAEPEETARMQGRERELLAKFRSDDG
jgi:probable rRNA maturation factor